MQAVIENVEGLDKGSLRVAEKKGTQWVCHEWIKKAILLSFRLNSNKIFSNGLPLTITLPRLGLIKFLKNTRLESGRISKAAFRAVPGSIIRHSAYIAPDVILMPSFINVGAYVGPEQWWIRG